MSLKGLRGQSPCMVAADFLNVGSSASSAHVKFIRHRQIFLSEHMLFCRKYI